MTDRTTFLTTAAMVALGGPLVLGVMGALRDRNEIAATPDAPARDWTLVITSTLLYILAFNLVFFVQELFLVVPKALTPGLRPTLFHNNHHWDGDNPLAGLFQGTGALAIGVVAILAAVWAKLRRPRSAAARLFVVWVIFQGAYQSLPQVVIGAVLPQNDVGMAMQYLEVPTRLKIAAAFVALGVMAIAGFRLTGQLLALAPGPGEIETCRRRRRFVFRAATLPALLALPVSILFRVPGTLDQVVLVPIVVAVLGIAWMQASACWATTPDVGGVAPVRSYRSLVLAVVVLFAIFHLVLRPGVRFY